MDVGAENLQESAAAAVPSEWGEDEMKIVVVPRPGITVEPRELMEFLSPRLPRFMLLRRGGTRGATSVR